MKILSQISRKYKNKSYRKFWVIIPIKIIKDLSWKTGQELKAEVKNNKLILNEK